MRGSLLTGDVEVCLCVGRPADAVGRSTPVPPGVVAQRPDDHQRAVAADLRARHEAGHEAHVDAVAEPLVRDVGRVGGRLAVEADARALEPGRVARRHDDVRVRCTADSTHTTRSSDVAESVYGHDMIAILWVLKIG